VSIPALPARPPHQVARAAPEDSRGGPINYSDVDWDDLVPDGASQAPVEGYTIRAGGSRISAAGGVTCTDMR
jgi:hypothetical protein